MRWLTPRDEKDAATPLSRAFVPVRREVGKVRLAVSASSGVPARRKRHHRLGGQFAEVVQRLQAVKFGYPSSILGMNVRRCILFVCNKPCGVAREKLCVPGTCSTLGNIADRDELDAVEWNTRGSIELVSAQVDRSKGELSDCAP